MELQELKIDRSAGSSRRGRRGRSPWFGRGIVLLVGVALTWLFWAPITRVIDDLRLPKVSVFRVTETNPASVGAIQGAAANGYVVAARRAALSADTPGRIVEMHVVEGSVVREGDLVARLYPDEFAAAVQRAEADLLSARADVIRAEAQIQSSISTAELGDRNVEAAAADVRDAEAAETFAAAQLQREEQLLEDGIASIDSLQERRERADRTRAQRFATEARLQAATASAAEAKHRIAVARATFAGAEAMVGIRDAALAQARATLSKTDVRAPFDGIVVLKDAEIGEVVSPNSQGGSNARGSVCTLVDFESLEVQADVQETTIAEVELGMPATIFLDAYPDAPYPGVVSRIWPTADRQKGTIEVRVKFEQRDDKLRPDMGVRVVFGGTRPAESAAGSETDSGSPRTPEIVVPDECIVEVDGKTGTFVVERETVRFVEVTLGAKRGGRIVVEDGLRAGQDIVRAPSSDLSDGDRVQIAG